MTRFLDKWLAWIVLIGIVCSIVIVRHDASVQADKDRRQAAANVRAAALASRQGCQRTGVQKALSSAGWLRASQARRADGNVAAANYYEGIADGTILTIAAPPAYEGSRVLAEVQPKRIAGRIRYVLSDRAERLQRIGCERAYPLA